jgi:hypothetical protein
LIVKKLNSNDAWSVDILTKIGELINLMQVDASKIEAFLPQLHVLWDGMFQICGYMAILYSILGW